MAEFLEAYKNTFANEGGYSNVASDKGGETYCGISRHWHPNWSGWAIVDANKPLSHGEVINDNHLAYLVKLFYKTSFWDKVSGDFIGSQRIAGFVFDWLVTSWDDAVKAVQRVAGVPADGKFGKQTLIAVNKIEDEAAAMVAMKVDRIAYYKGLHDPDNEKGWIARVNRF